MTTTKLQPEIALDHGPDSKLPLGLQSGRSLDHCTHLNVFDPPKCVSENVLFTPVDGTSSRENYDYPPVIKGNNRKKKCIVHVPVFFPMFPMFSHVLHMFFFYV